MSDIVERLRFWAFKFQGKGNQETKASDFMSKAADEIEQLKAERDAAVKALRFLLDHGAYLTERVPDDLKAAIDAARSEK